MHSLHSLVLAGAAVAAGVVDAADVGGVVAVLLETIHSLQRRVSSLNFDFS